MSIVVSSASAGMASEPLLPYPVRLESGPWFAAGTMLDGPAVHEQLRRAYAEPATARPRAVYVHVPFCGSICSFCALYTRAVAPDAHGVFDEYLDAVRRSLERHPWRSLGCPPTTVHFGGGTPLFLGLSRFATLARAVGEAFGQSATCEWAVETTTSSIDAETMDVLRDLGFGRVHLGIQTLHDETRSRVGRHEPGATAIRRIEALVAAGFNVSVDLIIGFEGVGGATVNDDLRRLYAAGVRMFSICELRERGATRLGIADPSRKSRETYDIWHGIWSAMADHGLRPIHLGQFGRTQDDNRYFTHPARGEDCVAIGPYAHGSCGDLYFGNLLLPDYYHALRAGRTPIASGIEYGEPARVIRALERELMAHAVTAATLAAMTDMFAGRFSALLARWRAYGLLQPGADPVALTADGSWFVGNMIAEARRLSDNTIAVM
jgi:coproporphyrinogen III oxidase-like Fe-S oxidoreductase